MYCICISVATFARSLVVVVVLVVVLWFKKMAESGERIELEAYLHAPSHELNVAALQHSGRLRHNLCRMVNPSPLEISEKRMRLR